MGIRIEDISEMDFSDVASGERLEPVSPGDILSHDSAMALKGFGR